MRVINFRALGSDISFNPELVTPPVLKEDLFPRPCSLALDISGSCNLNCIYCAESSTMPKREPMQLKTLNQAIDTIFNWSDKKSGISIHLGSGEPLLNLKILRALDQRAKMRAQENNQDLSLYLTTNGTLLDDEIVTFLIKGNWNVKISIDGNQVIHDQQRVDKTGKGTYSKIHPHVIKLSQQIPDRFSTTSVLCHDTNPRDVFYAIVSLGVRRIEIVPIAAKEGSKLSLQKKDFDAYKTFIFEYAQRIAQGEDLPINIRFHNRLLRTLGFKNSRVPCSAGRTFFAVGPQGSIYPCFRFVGLSKYELGDLSGISIERVRWFTTHSGLSYEQRTQCRDCWASPLCGGACYACIDLIGSGAPLPSYCEIVRIESEAALWLSSYLRENNPERLIKFTGIENKD